MTPPAPSHKRPGHWTPLPATFPDDAKPSALVAEFGAPGPYTLIVLITVATTQSYTGGEWGCLRLGWAALAQKVGVDVTQAQVIVKRLAELGEIDLAEAEFGFSARLTGWLKWHGPQAKDRTGAERQRRHREKKSVTQRDGVTQIES